MMQTIIQLLSGALGSIGFGLLFHLNRRYLPAAGVGGQEREWLRNGKEWY